MISTASCCAERLPATRRGRRPYPRRPSARSRLGRSTGRDRGGVGGAFRARQQNLRARSHTTNLPLPRPCAAAPTKEAISHLRRALDSIGHIANKGGSHPGRSRVACRVGSCTYGDPRLPVHRRCWRSICASRRFAISWANAWISSRQSGASGCSAPARGETNASRRLGARLFILAEKFDDTGLKMQAHHAMWSASLVCGDLGMARAHAQSGLALFDA